MDRPDPDDRAEIRPVPRAEPERGDDALLPPGEETAQLVEKAQGGDPEALNELFARYYGRMVDLARRRLGPRLRTKEEADDLAQTTFREATRDFARYEYRGPGSLLRWLLQILQNKIRDKAEYYAAGKRDVSRERSADDGDDAGRYERPSTDLSATSLLRRKEELSFLREALFDLSPEHRQAITLVFFQGLPLREAGRRMDGRSEDAVRMLLRRAEARLRELLERRLASGS